MGASAGAGSPISFKCPRCRAMWSRRKSLVVRTGKERPYSHARHSALGTRSTRISREYKCRTCGHQGWSNHSDLKLYTEIW